MKADQENASAKSKLLLPVVNRIFLLVAPCFLLFCLSLVPPHHPQTSQQLAISVSTETITRRWRRYVFCANPFLQWHWLGLLPAAKSKSWIANANSSLLWALVSWFSISGHKAANSCKKWSEERVSARPESACCRCQERGTKRRTQAAAAQKGKVFHPHRDISWISKRAALAACIHFP